MKMKKKKKRVQNIQKNKAANLPNYQLMLYLIKNKHKMSSMKYYKKSINKKKPENIIVKLNMRKRGIFLQ